MGIPITVMAEEKILGGTADGDGLRATIVTDLRSKMINIRFWDSNSDFGRKKNRL